MVYWITVAVLAGIGVVLFVLPHHKGDFDSASLKQDFEEIVDSDASDGPGVLILTALFGLGCLGVFMPALQAMALALLSAEASRKVLIGGGVLLILTSALTLFMEVLSNTSFMWGGGTNYKITTPVAYLAPLFPFLTGVVSIVMGAMRVRMP